MRTVSTLALALVTAATIPTGSAAARQSPWRTGEPMLHVHLPDIETGAPVDLADYRGKKVLLAEFASW